MLRRYLSVIALSVVLALSGCSGVSLDYLIARAMYLFSSPVSQPAGPVFTPTPAPASTRLVELATATVEE